MHFRKILSSTLMIFCLNLSFVANAKTIEFDTSNHMEHEKKVSTLDITSCREKIEKLLNNLIQNHQKM